MKKDEIIYVGIDFSKEKFNACLLAACAGVMGECEFPNTKAGYLSLIRWTKKVSELGKAFDPSNVLYCGEHTGMYSIGLSDYLYGKGFKVWLENALMIKYGSGFQRGKSDKQQRRENPLGYQLGLNAQSKVLKGQRPCKDKVE